MVEVKPQKLTASHIRKIKETYHKKKLDDKHSKVMVKKWKNPKHVFNNLQYREKLANAKLGKKNPNSKKYKK